jgi:redox-sensitive bicupin YhaK (pirin superfamily)
MTDRTLIQIVPGTAASDGAGVKLFRSLGQTQKIRWDPFLMLDEFASNDPNDYIGGFPSHPHRGFETVTYMLEGHMLHEDHLGNRGNLKGGDVQWMTAARGIVHSEMPQQKEGRLHGFQLWINLPAREKMKAASYRDIPSSEVPTLELPNGGCARVIAGSFAAAGRSAQGPIKGLSTEPLFFDVSLTAGSNFEHALPEAHNAFLYVYEGEVLIGTGNAAKPLSAHAAGLLSPGSTLTLSARSATRFLLLAGRPVNEPIVQYGPFVMNTRAEIEQTIQDYQSGRFVSTITQELGR